MNAEDVRALFGYDRWATERVLAVADGLDATVWSNADVVGGRSIGSILVHQFGAATRWRISLESQGDKEGPEPEDEPLIEFAELRRRWEAEWAAVDAWVPTLSDGYLAYVHGGVPIWQMVVHMVNHGTQHRSEAAMLLTAEGRSPGELDLINYAEGLAGGS
ncbi:MAG: DinB family protein [bacterium]